MVTDGADFGSTISTCVDGLVVLGNDIELVAPTSITAGEVVLQGNGFSIAGKKHAELLAVAARVRCAATACCVYVCVPTVFDSVV